MTVELFERSSEQRLAALARANEVRVARARMKRRLRDHQDAADVVAAPPWFAESMKLVDLVVAIPGVGPMRARRLLIHARVSDAKTIGGLSPRQRGEVVDLLHARGARG